MKCVKILEFRRWQTYNSVYCTVDCRWTQKHFFPTQWWLCISDWNKGQESMFYLAIFSYPSYVTPNGLIM